MSTYHSQNGRHVYRDGAEIAVAFTPEDGALIVEALNEVERLHGPARPIAVDLSDLALRHAATKVRAARPGVEPQTALAVIQALVVLGWRPPTVPGGDLT